jgi:flagellar biosynthetic protein FliR
MMLQWLEQLPIFLLIFVRLTAFFVSAPIFSMRGVPSQFKIGFGFFVSLVAFTTVNVDQPIPLDLSLIIIILKEVMVGLALGFVASLILYTVQVAGAFIDFQMGFAIANVVDPQTGAQVPILGNFKYMLALLFLLTVDGHHMMLDGVFRSYQMVPIEAMFIPIGSEEVARFITDTFVQMFLVAFQLALPIVGSLFLVDVALGIVARTVPQLNVFVVGLPLKILVGFVVILITIPTFFFLLKNVMRNMIETMGQLLQLLGG